MSFASLIPPERLPSLAGMPLRILDVRSEAAYREGHVLGAIRVDRDLDLSAMGEPGFDPACGGRHPLPSSEHWRACLKGWGLRPGLPVLAYDEAANGDGAARLWWMLRASGFQQVALLDGGFKAYAAAGLPVSTEGVAMPGDGEGEPVPDWGAMPRIDLESLEGCLGRPDARVVDVRAAERWRGEVEPFDPVPGRIPGTINLPWMASLDAEGRMQPAEALHQRFVEGLGGVSPDRVIVHCGSGVTACHTLFALERAGLPGAALYVGSYSEWCRNREVAKG